MSRHESRTVGEPPDHARCPAGGLQLTAVIDRTEYGLEWNAPLPKGGFALGNEVTLSVDLELARA